jgi:hypothetical protein
MGIFSKFKNSGNFNLSKSDFKTGSDDFEVISVKVSDDFYDLFPQAKKNEKCTGESTLITNTSSVSLFENKVVILYDPNEIELNEDIFINQINRNLNWIVDNENGIKCSIAKKLISLKNESWLKENETELTETEFIKRIKLTSIFFFGKGNSELIFNDGNLFCEHEIVAVLNTKYKLTDINIRG